MAWYWALPGECHVQGDLTKNRTQQPHEQHGPWLWISSTAAHHGDSRVICTLRKGTKYNSHSTNQSFEHATHSTAVPPTSTIVGIHARKVEQPANEWDTNRILLEGSLPKGNTTGSRQDKLVRQLWRHRFDHIYDTPVTKPLVPATGIVDSVDAEPLIASSPSLIDLDGIGSGYLSLDKNKDVT